MARSNDPYRGHVPLSPELRLPKGLVGTQRYLATYDKDLRLRRSVERPGLFVLERRVRQKPAINTAMRDVSDMHVQARDGYLHVCTVAPSWVWRPTAIVRALREQGLDIWAAGGAAKVIDEIEYEEDWAKITRRRRRMGVLRDIAMDSYDLLSRIGDKDGTSRTRCSVPSQFSGAGLVDAGGSA